MILDNKKLIIIFLGLLFLTSTNISSAASPGLSPFGGMITKITLCTCNLPRIMIEYVKVRPEMPTYLTFNPFASTLYSYYSLKPGSYILGTTISPDVCIWGHKCRKFRITELIGIVGTSH